MNSTAGSINKGEEATTDSSLLKQPRTAPGGKSRAFNRVWEAIIFLAYVGLVLWLTIHHEPWRDEADVWLMVRDNSFGELFRLMGYCGSPMLWHLTLWPLAKAGAPYLSMNILNALFAIAAAALLMFCAPLALVTRTVILFSYLFSYEYPIVARSYQLSVLLIFLLAAMHTKRSEKPIAYSTLLALLANTNTHALIIALVLGFVQLVFLFRERTDIRSILKFVLPVGIGVILSAVQLRPPADGQFAPNMLQSNWEAIPLVLKETFLPSIAYMDHSITPAFGDYVALFPVLIAISAVVLAVRKSRFALSCLCLSWIGLMSLFVFKYTGSVRHWGLLLVVAIYALWVAKLESEKKHTAVPEIVFALTLVFSVFTASQAWVSETENRFSDGPAIARFLKQNGLLTVPLAAYRDFSAESLLPYLPEKRFYYPEIKRNGTHMLWNKNYTRWLTEKQLIRRVNRKFGESSEVLILVADCVGQKIDKLTGFKQIYRSKDSVIVSDERFSIFMRTARDTNAFAEEN